MTRDVAERDSSAAVPPPTTEQQAVVLQAIYDSFRQHGTWPTFITIDRPIRREHNWDTAAIVQSVPESVLVRSWHGNRPIAGDKLCLCLLGFTVVLGSSDDTERFTRTLRWLAQREMEYEPPLGSDATPQVTSQELAQHLDLGDDDPLALQRLITMLQLNHWGVAGIGQLGQKGWLIRIGQDIWRFRNVQCVEDCVQARENWVAENWRRIRPNVMASPPIQQEVQVPVADSPYVNETVVASIRVVNGHSKFDVTKLLGLIDELNDNYANRNTYASHALLRAILDHVPPIFELPSFRQVADNYAWGRTDQKYIKRLADFRDQADDALHRQISSKPDVLGFEDMPASVCVDRLLQECAERL